MSMECEDFEDMLDEMGIKVSPENPESLHKQMGEIDGTGAPEDTIDAIDKKLGKCYSWYDSSRNVPRSEELENQKNPETIWKELDASAKKMKNEVIGDRKNHHKIDVHFGKK